MKTGLLALSALMMLGLVPSSFAQGFSQPIWGTWFFHRIFYQGQFREPLSPDLRLYFEFVPEGEDRVWWSRENQPGRCERKGRYRFEQGKLNDTVTWVSPDNDLSCATDPDMQLGRSTENRAEIRDGELWLHLPFAEEELVYVFRRIGDSIAAVNPSELRSGAAAMAILSP